MIHPNLLFCIPCKDSDYVSRCIESIRAHHVNDPIIICDSCSDDKSYFDCVWDENIQICDIQNRHYMDGVVWYAHENFPHVTHYIFLQDSIELMGSLLPWIGDDFVGVRWFPSHYDDDRDRRMMSLMASLLEWDVPNDMMGLFGPMMIIPRPILEKLYNMGMSKILPETKKESNSMERVWGYVLSRMGIDITEHSIDGRFTGSSDGIVKKYYVERQ